MRHRHRHHRMALGEGRSAGGRSAGARKLRIKNAIKKLEREVKQHMKEGKGLHKKMETHKRHALRKHHKAQTLKQKLAEML